MRQTLRFLKAIVQQSSSIRCFPDIAKPSSFLTAITNACLSTTPSLLREAELSSTSVYKVRIITGNVRGAGTTANIRLKLIGLNGQSPSFLLKKDRGFAQGSVETEILQTERRLGPLRMVLVEREASGSDVDRESWFLEKLIVDESNGNQQSFPCMQWFGMSACGSIQAPLKRHLLPASLNVAEMMKKKRTQVEVKASGMVIPHPQKVLQGIKAKSRNGRGLGGEDAFFYAFGKNGVFGMGVADGVYAWREKGIDSGRFAFVLMEQAYLNVKMGYDDVFQVLQTSARKVETEGVYGSSTCCLLTINTNQGRLNGANLGDSGFIVVGCRDYGADQQLIFRTPQQEHEFGRPYQLGHHHHSSPPQDAMLYNFQVFPGDTIIMGTDGLFDNVFLPRIVEQVRICRTEQQPPQRLVRQLMNIAYEISLEKKVDSPYSRGFTEAFNLSQSGGKPDDITIVVAYIA